MTVALLNNYVLFPTRPNWRESVTWKRSWQTEIAGALQGQEDRRSLRRVPRVTLQWLITTLSTEETALLEATIQAALKSGLACTGYWGRAGEIKTAVTASTAELWPGSWPWAAGDYILFVDPDTGLYDAILVDSVAGNTLVLHTAVSRTYKACGLCWPIIFGKLKADPLAPMTSDKAEVKLTLLNALPSPATVPSCDDWCGHCNAALAAIPGSPCSAEKLAECTPLLPPTALTVDSTACSESPITVNRLTPTLSWTPPIGAAGYIVEIFTGSCGGTLIHTSPVQNTASYTVPGGALDVGTTYYWRVKATPASGYCAGEVSPCCALTTACPTITLDDTLPDGNVGAPYTGTIIATGGSSPYNYLKTSGTLPPGLTLATNGVLSGVPTACGEFAFTVTAAYAEVCTGSREYLVKIFCPTCSPDCSGCGETVGVTLSGFTGAKVGLNRSWLAHNAGNGSWDDAPPATLYGVTITCDDSSGVAMWTLGVGDFSSKPFGASGPCPSGSGAIYDSDGETVLGSFSI